MEKSEVDAKLKKILLWVYEGSTDVDDAIADIKALVVASVPEEETGRTSDDEEAEACKYGWNSCRDRMLNRWSEK